MATGTDTGVSPKWTSLFLPCARSEQEKDDWRTGTGAEAFLTCWVDGRLEGCGGDVYIQIGTNSCCQHTEVVWNVLACWKAFAVVRSNLKTRTMLPKTLKWACQIKNRLF